MVTRATAVGAALGWILAAAPAVAEARTTADEIPAFARRYGASCALCHRPMPKLNAFGATFAGNGYRLASEEPTRDTVATGDPELDLPRSLPLAIRLDGFVQVRADGRVASDLQMPYNLKVLSGGPISRSVSYYLYFFLFERGEVGGIEDAFLYLNDIAGAPVDVAAGQFQVSDPLFKRELRLEVQDYAVYRARVGEQPADFTYDRGVMLIAEAAGFTVTGILVNGNGRGPAGANRWLDDDENKNGLVHVTRDVLPGVRWGALGYYGRQRGTAPDSTEVTNRIWMAGLDATVEVGSVEVNLQALHREDSRATFAPGEPVTVVNGGFAELIWRSPDGPQYAYLLYNRVDASRPLLDVRLGGPKGIRRYETVSGGLGSLVRRNLRVYAEATWDAEASVAFGTVGVTTAF
jgi:hypothetical protein